MSTRLELISVYRWRPFGTPFARVATEQPERALVRLGHAVRHTAQPGAPSGLQNTGPEGVTNLVDAPSCSCRRLRTSSRCTDLQESSVGFGRPPEVCSSKILSTREGFGRFCRRPVAAHPTSSKCTHAVVRLSKTPRVPRTSQTYTDRCVQGKRNWCPWRSILRRRCQELTGVDCAAN